MNTQRLQKIINNMEKHNLEQMIVTSTSAIFYLTGKWIEPGKRFLALYINANGDKKLFLNELFHISEDLGADMHVYNDMEDPIKALGNVVIKNKAIGIDKEWPSHFLIRLMNKKLGLIFVNGSQVVDEVRMIKDSKELELMREASRVNDMAMEELVRLIPNNYPEKKLCKLLVDIYEKHDTYRFSFNPSVCYGLNAAEPHHEPDNSTVDEGDSVILDIGGRTNMYCSDMTRTVFYKNPKDEYKGIYNIVLEANLKAIDTVKPGVRLCDIDNSAREIIKKAGYGKYFTHRIGHNIGIDLHEFPDVSGTNEMIAEKGMVFSIEPGIYLPGKCGVRIEDLVVVTDNGCEVLNKYTKELQIL